MQGALVGLTEHSDTWDEHRAHSTSDRPRRMRDIIGHLFCASSRVPLPCPRLHVAVQAPGDEVPLSRCGNHPGLGESSSCNCSIGVAPRVPAGDLPNYNSHTTRGSPRLWIPQYFQVRPENSQSMCNLPAAVLPWAVWPTYSVVISPLNSVQKIGARKSAQMKRLCSSFSTARL